MTRIHHTGRITKLWPNECFVFGSNLAGRHGAGAALQARQQFGAVTGVGSGPTGRCYALPTKSEYLKSLSLVEIATHAQGFIAHARENPHTRFLPTAVGCGLAGYCPRDIAPLFANAPDNVVWPPEFSGLAGT